MDVADLVHTPDQSRERGPMKRLQHFLLLGAALFAISRWVSPPDSRARTPHRLAEEDLLRDAAIARGLAEDDIVVQRRVIATARQVGGLATDDTGALYQQARTLELDRGDPIVERRLVQQMRLLLASEARRDEPNEAELRAFFAAQRDRFALPARVGLTHVFFSSARRGERAEADARALLESLQTSGGSANPSGDPSLWPAHLPLQSVVELEKIFGPAATAVMSAPVETWAGPYRSPYGYHLVRIHERSAASAPAFDTVRPAVRVTLLDERAERHIRETLVGWASPTTRSP